MGRSSAAIVGCEGSGSLRATSPAQPTSSMREMIFNKGSRHPCCPGRGLHPCGNDLTMGRVDPVFDYLENCKYSVQYAR